MDASQIDRSLSSDVSDTKLTGALPTGFQGRHFNLLYISPTFIPMMPLTQMAYSKGCSESGWSERHLFPSLYGPRQLVCVLIGYFCSFPVSPLFVIHTNPDLTSFSSMTGIRFCLYSGDLFPSVCLNSGATYQTNCGCGISDVSFLGMKLSTPSV